MSLPIVPLNIPATRVDDPSLKKEEDKTRTRRQDNTQAEALEADQRAVSDSARTAVYQRLRQQQSAAATKAKDASETQASQWHRSEFKTAENQKPTPQAAADSFKRENLADLPHTDVPKEVQESSPAKVGQEGAGAADAGAGEQQQAQASLRKEAEVRGEKNRDAYAQPQRREAAPSSAKSAFSAPQSSKSTPPPPPRAQVPNLTPPPPKAPPPLQGLSSRPSTTPPSEKATPESGPVADGADGAEAFAGKEKTPSQPGQPPVAGRATYGTQNQSKPVVSRGVQMFAAPNSKGENHPPEMLAEQRALQVNYNKLTASVDVPVQAYAAAAGMFVVGKMFAKSGQNRESKVGLSKERDGQGEGTKTADGNERLLKKRMAGIGNTFV